MNLKLFLFINIFLLNILNANEAIIKNVQFKRLSNGTYNFDVTILHKDAGWKHYVNRWEILDNHNNIIATRTLFHPHVNEQPFTRSKNNVTIKDDIKTIFIRVHDSKHEYSKHKYPINLKK